MNKILVIMCRVLVVVMLMMTVYNYIAPRLIVTVALDELTQIGQGDDQFNILQNMKPHEQALAEVVLSELTYDVQSFERTNDGVVSTITFKTVDVLTLLKENMMTFFGYALTDWEDALKALFSNDFTVFGIEMITQLLEDETIKRTYLESTVNVLIAKEGLKWTPIIEQELINAIIGLPETFDLSAVIEQ